MRRCANATNLPVSGSAGLFWLNRHGYFCGGDAACFADVYGFIAADDVARATGIMIHKISAASGDNDFLGHIDAADFVIITTPQKANILADKCRQQLGATIPYFYPAADWQVLQQSSEMARLTMHVTKLTSADGPVTSIEDLRLALQSSL